MSKRLITIAQYLFFLGIGLFFAWLSVKNLNDDNLLQIKQALEGSRQWLIVPVFLMLVLSHYLRAIRWRLLMEPLGHRPSILNTFLAVMIGYFVNLGVPRLGELVKCTLLAKYEKIPADKLIGTIIIERIFDALTLLIVFALTLGVQPGLYGQLIDTFFPAPTPGAERSYSLLTLLIILSAITLLLLFWVLIKKKTLTQLQELITGMLQRVYAGISSIGALQRKGLFLLLSGCIWLLYLLAGYIGFFAFGETAHYGIKEALTILSAGSIGMIASPGGIGAYAFLVEKSMQLYGLRYSIAIAFGWLLWLAQTGVTIVAGFLSFIILPLYNQKNE